MKTSHIAIGCAVIVGVLLVLVIVGGFVAYRVYLQPMISSTLKMPSDLGAPGVVLSRARPPAYFSGFSLCNWPAKQDRVYALLAEDDTVWVLEFDGKAAAKFDAPRCGSLGHARGTAVKLERSEPEYLAVVVEFTNWERSILYLYDSTRTLVYQEIIPERCASIAAMSLDRSDTEVLLVGGEGKVWEYRIGEGSASE